MLRNLSLFLTTLTTALLAHNQTAWALIVGGCGASCPNGFNPNGHHNEPTLTDSLLDFAWRQALITIIFYISGYIFGRMVEKQKLSANISRKFVCILTFAASFGNSILIASETNFASNPIFVLLSLGILLLMLASLSEPVRKRSAIIKTIFASINRPEDAPYTLRWLSTEAVATSAVILIIGNLIWTYLFKQQGEPVTILSYMMLIPILASGLGDAFAEIIGKKWGKHHYTTRAIFSDRKYTRSIEGSAMVFLTTLIVGLVLAAMLPTLTIPLLFWKAVIFMPVTLTLAEALAPHTWDNPLLYLAGYATIALCLI